MTKTASTGHTNAILVSHLNYDPELDWLLSKMCFCCKISTQESRYRVISRENGNHPTSIYYELAVWYIINWFTYMHHKYAPNPLCIRTNIPGDNYLIFHYSDVIMSAMASQIASPTIVYSTVYSDADQRKHQSSASLAFVRGIHR